MNSHLTHLTSSLVSWGYENVTWLYRADILERYGGSVGGRTGTPSSGAAAGGMLMLRAGEAPGA